MTAPLKASKKKLYARPPRTAMEVYELLPETAHAEVINNALYMPPTPSYEHQDISISLSSKMRVFTDDKDLGKLLEAPLSVYLNENTVCEPDVFFISKNNLGIIQSGKIKGVPDLIIELLSPGNQNHDLKIKYSLYESFGVLEYFIIDPLKKEVMHYFLKESKYEKQPSTNGRINSIILNAGFSF
jgi:Uma2 family endonuclease